MIYFAYRPSDGAVKIGTSTCPGRRVHAVGLWCREKLDILAVMDGSYDKEYELHKRFDGLNISQEWFRLDDELLTFIAENGRDWEPSDDVSVQPKPRAISGPDGQAMSVVIIKNMIRLGWTWESICYAKIARTITEKTGRKFTGQKMSHVMGLHRLTPKTIEMIANGIGVTVKELTKPIPPAK